MQDGQMNRDGLLRGAAAYVLWGLSALYWPLLDPAGTLEILAHRIWWSLIVLIVLLTVLRRWRRFKGWRRPAPWVVGLLAVAAVLTAINWGVFIYAVTTERVVEASLGYFIAPLVMVVLGVGAFRERPSRMQWAAVGFGALGVAILAVAQGGLPWIALVLAGTFGLYGLVKKQVAVARVGAVEGMTVETALLLLPAVAYIGWLQLDGTATFGQVSVTHSALMIGASVVMLTPMLLFASAGWRIPLSILGLLQYLEPIVQFLIGVVVFREAMPPARWLAFAVVWIAIALLVSEAVRHLRRRRSRPTCPRSG
jgi:chloramphenicol-sensitive protein RarD